ncbi:MAG: prolipoprotein diacylglyceryl transferase [Flavobacteriales bacterium]|nr:prolipoprotein diacylglyceryl transferase [Flavobacteriales bacterium]
MYPTLYDLVLDIFGISIPAFKLVQSFGMMVALAFVAASFVLTSELKRKERIGQLSPTIKKVWVGKTSTVIDKIVSALVGFAFGYKILGLILEFDTVVPNPQDYILSLKGNILGGVLGAAFSVGSRIWEDRKESVKELKEIEVIVHPYQQVSSIVILSAVSGILGAKLFHNLENWDQMMADPLGALMAFSGLSFFGGFICATIVIWIYCKRNGLKIIHTTDAVLPTLILAYGIGRMGCQIAGDGDWGIPNDSPMPEWLSFMPEWIWKYNYPNNVLGIDLQQDFANMGLVSLTGYAYPTPIYETTMALIIFAFLWRMRKRWTTPGMMFSVYIILTGAERLLIEQVRVNNKILGLNVTQAEIISVVMIVLGIIGIFIVPKFKERLSNW